MKRKCPECGTELEIKDIHPPGKGWILEAGKCTNPNYTLFRYEICFETTKDPRIKTLDAFSMEGIEK